MPDVFDRVTGETFTVANSELGDFLGDERYVVESAVVQDTTGGTFLTDEEGLQEAGETVRLAPSAGRFAETRQFELEEQFDDDLRAGLEGVARGLTLGGSDLLFEGLGVDGSDLEFRQRVNPVPAIGGEVLGAIIPTLVSGGTAAPATAGRLGATAARIARTGGALLRATPAGLVARGASAAGRLVKGSGSLARVARAGVTGAVEGAAFDAGHQISNVVLRDEPLTIEGLASAIGSGALLGGAVGAGVGALNVAARKVSSMGGQSKAVEALDSRLKDVDSWVDDFAAMKKEGSLAPSQARLVDELQDVRKSLQKSLGKNLSLEKAFEAKPAKALDAIQDIDNYLAKADEIDAEFGRIARSSFDDGLAQALPQEAREQLRQLEPDALAKLLDISEEALPALKTEQAKDLAGLYAAARDVKRGGRGAAGRAAQHLSASFFGSAAGAALPGGGGILRNTAQKAANVVGWNVGGLIGAGVDIGDTIVSKVSTALEKLTGSAGRTASVKAATRIADNIRYQEEPSDRKAPAEARIEEVKRAAARPEETRARIARSLMPVTALNPVVGDKLGELALNRIMYLAQNAPAFGRSSPFGPTPTPRPPSKAEINQWLKIVRAVEDPLSIVEDLGEGSVSPQGVQAVKELYPTLFQEIQSQILVQAEELAALPYQSRLRISVLFDVPIEPTTEPQFIAATQQMYAQRAAEAQQAPPIAQSRAMPRSLETSQTKGQRLAER